MSLIIGNKIKANIPGTPTMSDKYDVMTGVVETGKIYEGQIVDLDKLLKDGKVVAADATTKRGGIVMHQNVKAQLPGYTGPQFYEAGEYAGVCIKGFILLEASPKFDGQELKIKDETIVDKTGALDLTGITNIVLTGKQTKTVFETNDTEKVYVEVEVK